MTIHTGLRAISALVLSSAIAMAQPFDPVKKATGWARVDKDGSIAFYDPATKKIYSWMKDGGIVGEVDVSKLAQAPEKWVLDFSFNAWVVSGKSLTYVDKSGKNFTVPLPYEVGDLAWDVNGFYLSYKTPEPFVEMRGYDSGSVVWYIRNRAMKDENTPVALHRVVVSEEKAVFLASLGSLQMEQVDATNGRSRGNTSFTYAGGAAPALTLGKQERGVVGWWLNRNMAVHAIPASQLPNLKQAGMLLAVENLGTSTVEFLATGLSEQHSFLGMLESEAVFMAPGGGLIFVTIKI